MIMVVQFVKLFIAVMDNNLENVRLIHILKAYQKVGF